MLKLKDLSKEYISKHAGIIPVLKCINYTFSNSGLYSILGESGCGKTTLLNLIGGLDTLTNGDILVDNKSIKDFKEKDFDRYRNQEIGFIFQDNNLLDNLTVEENVSLALSLSSIKNKERIKLVKEALEKVKLVDKLKKYPSELSGGEKQRVVLARALIKNPNIILADEPTGSLDEVNSLEIMKYLKELSKDHLVIMVTHSSFLANEFSDVILRMKNGQLSEEKRLEKILEKNGKNPRKINKNLHFFDAFKLSLKNIFSKKIKSFIVAFTLALGIGGLGLIVSIQNGFYDSLEVMESQTLSRYPISIEKTGLKSEDIFQLSSSEGTFPTEEEIGISSTNMEFLKTNNISQDFVNHLNNIDPNYKDAIKFNDNTAMNILYKDDLTDSVSCFTTSEYSLLANMATTEGNEWRALPDNKGAVLEDYDILSGEYPETSNEVALILDTNNCLPQNLINKLGLANSLNFEKKLDFCKVFDLKFKIISNNELYKKIEIDDKTSKQSGIFFKPGYELYNEGIEFLDLVNYLNSNIFNFTNSSNNENVDLNKNKSELEKLLKFIDLADGVTINLDEYDLNNEDDQFRFLTSMISTKYLDLYSEISNDELKDFYEDSSKGKDIKISCILRPKPDSFMVTLNPGVYYTNDLLEEFKKENGLYFEDENGNGVIDKKEDHRSDISKSFEENIYLEFDGTFSLHTRTILNTSTENDDLTEYLNNRVKFGLDNAITSISIYPKTFDERNFILSYINEYNKNQIDDNKIIVTDIAGIVFDNLENIVGLITIVLIILSSISIIVGVLLESLIVYSSINERKKDIGILRSLGARRLDISNIFLLESGVIGFISGIIGDILLVISGLTMNSVFASSFNLGTNISDISIILILLVIIISIGIHVLASIVPTLVASNKKPIECIRNL